MISKISGLNPVATSNHKEELSTSSNKSSEIAQKALNEMQNQAESSLCNRFVKILKDIIKKIQNCFFRCFYIKNDKIDSETERSLNPAKTTEKTDFEPSKILK
ncbi:MAG: hypothetical protein HWD61_02180 [Parachlamydiaceae bacterium]|nr:MAG: hypothetical protein HWD61_02180 [Parachlamydiaceae bacterium]